MDLSDELNRALAALEESLDEDMRPDHIYGSPAGSPPIEPWPTAGCGIVFLDFDGVLNSEQSYRQLGTHSRFGEPNVAALNGILSSTGARVVITSTWRTGYTMHEIAGFLERDGVLANRVAGKTQALGAERGLEIDAWLGSVPYEVSSYVVLDDHDDMAMHAGRLVRVSPELGLTGTDAERAIGILSIPR